MIFVIAASMTKIFLISYAGEYTMINNEDEKTSTYKPLKWFIDLNDHSQLLNTTKYSKQLIELLIVTIKKYRRQKTLNVLLFHVSHDIALNNMICNETKFIDDIYSKCSSNINKLKLNLLHIRLYCIFNNIMSKPRCCICGHPLENFLYRWENGIHKDTCSHKCHLKKFKRIYSAEPTIDEIQHLSYTAEQVELYTNQLEILVKEHPFSFFNTIKAKSKQDVYGDLKNFIYAKTQFLDFDCNFGTRCKYIIDKKYEIYRCNFCGKAIRKNLFATNRCIKFWCSDQCLNNDPEIKEKIGKKNQMHKKGKKY